MDIQKQLRLSFWKNVKKNEKGGERERGRERERERGLTLLLKKKHIHRQNILMRNGSSNYN